MIQLKNRIKQIRASIGMSQGEMAKRLNLSRNYISLVENGDRSISERTKTDICREFNVDRQWLETGEGEMFTPVSPEDQLLSDLNGLMDLPDDDIRRRWVHIISQMSDEEVALARKYLHSLLGE